MDTHETQHHLQDEGPSEQDLQRFGSDTIRCPHCQEELYDEASVCPSCLEPVSTHKKHRPVARFVLLGIMLLTLLGFLLLSI